jgi:predicted methyltransferase
MRFLAPLLALALLACTPAQMQSDSPLRPHGLLAAPHRTPVNVARDPFRHPFGTLSFFGIREDSVVVEILPGSAGYYMEILAPFVRDQGLYIAASRRRRRNISPTTRSCSRASRRSLSCTAKSA